MDIVSAPGSIIDHGLVWLCVVVRALTHNLTNPMLRNAGAGGNKFRNALLTFWRRVAGIEVVYCSTIGLR